MNLTRVTLATASSVLVLATLAACGSDTDSSSTAAGGGNQAAGGQAGQAGQAGGQGGVRPGASGEVAAVSGTTAQVQSQASGQVAVSWTGDTTFTAQVEAALADVTVGSCVAVTSAADDSDTDSDTPATEVTAATVRITEASDDGGCGFGGGGGQRPGGAPSDLPSDRPSDLPTDMPNGGGRGSGTVGEVTAVSGTGFTVSATQPGADTDATEVTVTVGDDTTYTTTAKSTASAVKVGVCVNAQGDTDDTGAVTATTIGVSQPVDGECTGGFGMGGPGGRPGGAS